MTPLDWRNAAAGSASWAANRSMAARVRTVRNPMPHTTAPTRATAKGSGAIRDTDAKASPQPANRKAAEMASPPSATMTAPVTLRGARAVLTPRMAAVATAAVAMVSTLAMNTAACVVRKPPSRGATSSQVRKHPGSANGL
jgi:hypothetical protein